MTDETINYLISITGLLLSFYAIQQTRKLKKRYVIKVRLPELTSDLNKGVNNVAKSLGENNWQDNKADVISEISKIKGQLQSVVSKLDGNVKKEILDLISKFEKTHPWADSENLISSLTSKKAWDFYSDMCVVTARLTELVKDVRGV